MTTMTDPQTKLARSFLFVPGDRPERFAKAQASGADAVILDLEDAVGPSAKPAARQAILQYLTQHNGRALWVRINAIGTATHAEDLAFLKLLSKALVGGATADSTLLQIMLPKVESRELTEQMLNSLAHAPGVNIIAQIESALGLDQARDFAQSPSITRLAFGSIDYSLDLGLAADDNDALLGIKAHGAPSAD
jgi:citrate lyase beta subunit